MGNGTAGIGMKRARRNATVGLLAAGLALAGLAALPQTVAASGSSTILQVSRSDGRDAPWLRFGLLGLLGIALSGGAVVQYRSSATAPPYQPRPRRQRATPPTPPVAEAQANTVETTPDPAPLRFAFPSPPPATVVDWRSPADAPIALAPYRQQRDAFISRSQPQTPATLSPAEEACARAVAAAHRYDRQGARDEFAAALALDPAVKPSASATFWEIPSGGHADLAQAYLLRGQTLDARSVVTMALLTFPHNRELEALLRELAPERFAATA